MMSSLRLAGAVALCGTLLLCACAKKSSEQTTTVTSSDTTQSSSATSAPDAGAAASPAADATVSAAPAASTPAAGSTTAATTTNGAASGGYIDLPVYPGAAEGKDQGMSMSTGSGSIAIKVYSSKDDAKKVAEWYKSHLPAEFKGGILTSGDKTVGTFSDEHADGDQSVVVANQTDGTTRIQLATKHGQ